ncbi:pseudouridine synthase [Silvanigrella aquatica]|uniref:Pseudouridine synthase n=1 Tax=Silvanigrella aquatica TaxID=1915309 RepID=A0A1L4CZC0_9BACT|nr:pseudouridine synthase [Silvanigrella aquatica]APJ03299.1 hypothetical protein AXG55_05030 [Silvanigrella aquatica]
MVKDVQKNQNSEFVRLNVLLQEFGVSSRRKADELIEAGQVKVDGKVVKKLGTKVDRAASISVDGKALKSKPAKMIYLLNKPFMTITSRKDEKERPTIFDLPEIKKLPLNVQSVGRLDYRSEGLLVLTNDGDLSLALSHPKYSVEKTYAVLTSSSFTIEDAEKLKKGIELEDGPAKVISLKIGNKEKLGNSVGQWIELVVTEGRNRLVRRMMEALGLSVVRLVRVAIGDLRLPGKLEPGKIRPASEAEIKYLNDIKKDMEQQESKKKKSSYVLSNEVIAKRKLIKKMSLNDSDYAREAERREKRATLVAKTRKQSNEEIQNKKRSSEWQKEESASSKKTDKNDSQKRSFEIEKNDSKKRSFEIEKKGQNKETKAIKFSKNKNSKSKDSTRKKSDTKKRS